MAQQDVDAVRHHQPFLNVARQPLHGFGGVNPARAPEIHTDQVEPVTVLANCHALLPEHPDSCAPEELRDRVLHSGPGIMVPQTFVEAEGRPQAGKCFHHAALLVRVEGDIIAGQHRPRRKAPPSLPPRCAP